MRTKKLMICFLALGVVLAGCKKKEPAAEQEEPAPSPYFVRMTDAPGPYTAVNIDLQGVEITSNGVNTLLNVNPGIYNLINFSNGLDTLIATGSLIAEKVQQIRLILGPNNSVVSGGTTYPLATPSAQQSGLKLQVHHQLQAGVAYYVLLDFDAYQSIVNEGNGSFSLKPVIRTIETALSGSIKGMIFPGGVSAAITATSGSLIYSTVVNAAGEFLLAGLPPGTYSLTVTPVSPYNPVTINGLTVTVGLTTNTGTINI